MKEFFKSKEKDIPYMVQTTSPMESLWANHIQWGSERDVCAQ